MFTSLPLLNGYSCKNGWFLRLKSGLKTGVLGFDCGLKRVLIM